MLVKLKRNVFFDKLYKAEDWGTVIPEEYRDKLPQDAVLLEEEIPITPAGKPKPIALSTLAKKRLAVAADVSDDDLN
jgi:hypothetical protein